MTSFNCIKIFWEFSFNYLNLLHKLCEVGTILPILQVYDEFSFPATHSVWKQIEVWSWKNLLYLPPHSFTQQMFTKCNYVSGTIQDTEVIEMKIHGLYFSLSRKRRQILNKYNKI